MTNSTPLSWESEDGRDDPEQRYAVYKICPSDEREKVLVFTCGTSEAVGVGIVLNAQERMFLEDGDPCRIGLLDRQPKCENCGGHGEDMNWLTGSPVVCRDCEGSGQKKTGTWLVLPWGASPRQVSDAGRVLGSARKRDVRSS